MSRHADEIIVQENIVSMDYLRLQQVWRGTGGGDAGA